MQRPGSYGLTENSMNSHSGLKTLHPSLQSSKHGDDLYKRSFGTKISNRTRACDFCRSRKTRCDGPRKVDNICTNCLQNKKACTYVEASTPRGPPKSYIIGLEDKLEKMEILLQRLRPGQDFSAELGPPVVRDSWKDPKPSSEISPSASRLRVSSPSKLAPHLDSNISIPLSSHLKIHTNPSTSSKMLPYHRTRQGSATNSTDSSSSQYDSSDADELVDNFEKGMQRLTLHSGHSQLQGAGPYDRFHGQSSYIKLVDATRKLRQAHIMAQKEELGHSSGSNTSTTSPSPEISNALRRLEFWRAPKWELVYEGLHVDSPKLLDSVLEQFPEPDLAEELIEHYFLHVNSLLSLLNRQIFLRQWRERLHNKDIWFSALSMCILALGSRWSNDPRVIPRDHTKSRLDWTKAGWDYFNVVISIHRARRSLLCTATLFEVQTFSLVAWYLRGTPDYAVGGTMVTVGIRKAQDVGAHRKAVYERFPTVDEELWKRAFWLLVILDRTGSASLGRPCSLGEEDYDLDLPLEVDDEFWATEDPTLAFQQPSGLPSRVTAFNAWIGITQIVGFALRTLYALDPKKFFLGRRTLPEPEILVKQLNIALDEWFNSLPEFLQWPVTTDDLIFSNQSASLHLSYHFAYILIYRTFIPFSQILPPGIRGVRIPRSSQKPSALSTPALPICVNAAKSCARIIQEQMLRGFSNVAFLITMCNVCTAVLIVHLWDLKAKEISERSIRISTTEDVKPQYALAIQSAKDDIEIFLNALEWAKPHYSSVAQILDDLRASFPHYDSPAADQYISGRQEPSSYLPSSEGSRILWSWDSPEVPSNAPSLSTLSKPDWNNMPPGYSPLRTNSYSIPTASFERNSNPLIRRDSDPYLRQRAFGPTYSNSSSSAQIPSNQHTISDYSAPNRESLPYSSTSSSRHDYSPYDSYRANDELNTSQQLPTSDARSLPPEYDKRGSTRDTGDTAWNGYRPVFP
ncbi:fungal-specific transcription factor domain-containing protein [Lentinula lateritia]|uniref:Fungal-specific transcription factor domain-containing protein n=1 Tax=Lentinula lateritia TaxID=40482 RepID=A0ABQ8VP55_9AGAR|nr:fungal-specific transcription factor domain-containing protein [Lentinula lateritia]